MKTYFLINSESFKVVKTFEAKCYDDAMDSAENYLRACVTDDHFLATPEERYKMKAKF